MDYATLGLNDTATLPEIKRAYYKLALKYHPDRNPAGADDFRRVNEAYARLAQCSVPEPSLDEYFRELFGNTLVDYIIRLGTRETIQLTPTIDALFNQQVFLYRKGTEIYPIPLWHHELSYESFDVVCSPRCPDGVTVDSENNVHVLLTTSPSALLLTGESVITLGTHTVTVKASELKLVPTQIIRRVGAGIPRIHEENFLDASTLSDILVTVTFI